MYDNVKTIESGGVTSFVFGFLKGAAVGVVLTMAIFLIFALLLSYTPLDESAVVYIAYATEAAAAFVAGFVPAKKAGSRGLVTGAGSGFLYILIIWIAASLAADGFFLSPHIFIVAGISAVSGALGGVFGVNTKPVVSNKKKR